MRAFLLAAGAAALAACGDNDDAAARAAPEAPPAQSQASASAPAKQNAASADDINMGAPQPRPARTGEQIFEKQCSWCHAPGIDHPGTMQLGATRGEEFAVLAEREDLNADYVKYIVRHGLNAMPPFKPTVITDEELDALAAYLAAEE